jgi:CRISPR-associated protein Csm2
MSYFDKNDNIRAELLDKEAYDQARSFIVYYFDKRKGREELDNNKSLTSAQLRRFFNEFRQLEKKVKIDGFEKVKPLIKMTKSKAAYAANPKKPKIPRSFQNFLVNHIDNVNSEKDFQAFMLHFEAVVGFFYGFEGVKNN